MFKPHVSRFSAGFLQGSAGLFCGFDPAQSSFNHIRTTYQPSITRFVPVLFRFLSGLHWSLPLCELALGAGCASSLVCARRRRSAGMRAGTGIAVGSRRPCRQSAASAVGARAAPRADRRAGSLQQLALVRREVSAPCSWREIACHNKQNSREQSQSPRLLKPVSNPVCCGLSR
jgi:hypothetical protein